MKQIPAEFWMIDIDRANRMLASMSLEVEIQNTGNTPLYVKKNGEAIIPIYGLLCRYEGMFSMLGHSCYARIEAAVEAAVEDEEVERIVFDIDSPGGEIRGMGLCASVIKASPKPTLARVAGQGCSAALYLAMAADEIEADVNAELGSIGVICMASRPRRAEDKAKDLYVEFVSAVSPLKTAGIDDDEVALSRQQLADDYGEAFVGWVAERRKVSREYVIENFGKGSTMSAARAEDVGMIDRVLYPSESQPILSISSKVPEREPEMTEEEMQAKVAELLAKIAELEAALQAEREKNSEREEVTEGEMAPEAQALAAENAQLRDRVVALETLAKRAEMDRVIEGALAQGKLTPAERETAEKVFAKGLFDEVYGSRKPGSMIPQPKGHGQAGEEYSAIKRYQKLVAETKAARGVSVDEAHRIVQSTNQDLMVELATMSKRGH